MVEKSDLLQVVKFPYPKTRFLVTLRSFFSTYNFFHRRRWLFPVSTFKQKYLNEIIGSLAGLKKSYSFFFKITDFGRFRLPRSTCKVDFLNVQANFRKVLGLCRGEGY